MAVEFDTFALWSRLTGPRIVRTMETANWNHVRGGSRGRILVWILLIRSLVALFFRLLEDNLRRFVALLAVKNEVPDDSTRRHLPHVSKDTICSDLFLFQRKAWRSSTFSIITQYTFLTHSGYLSQSKHFVVASLHAYLSLAKSAAPFTFPFLTRQIRIQEDAQLPLTFPSSWHLTIYVCITQFGLVRVQPSSTAIRGSLHNLFKTNAKIPPTWHVQFAAHLRDR